VRAGNLTSLVTALLGVGNLVLDLDGAGARLDHLLGQQVGRFFVTEAGVDISNDRDNVGFEVVDLVDDFLFPGLVARIASRVQVVEQVVEFTRVRLLKEGVEFLDQRRYGSLLVHGLVRQRTELGTHGRNHPAGQVQVAALGGTVMTLDAHHLLLANKAVPAAQGLGVLGRILVVCRHVFTHDLGRVLGNIQTGVETVLGAHARDVFRRDVIPGLALAVTQRGDLFNVFLY